MGVKWTPEQESAIIAPKDSSLDNQTLLVAAAAGSRSEERRVGKECRL